MWIEESSSASREAAEGSQNPSAKQLEKLQVSSGFAIVIDQFMLGNTQFVEQLPAVESGFEGANWARNGISVIRTAVEQYGGAVLELSAGTWAVLRDPIESLFVLFPFSEDSDPQIAKDRALDARGNLSAVGRVFVDTRCLVFIDAAMLANRELLREYREMRLSGQDKVARDRIRELGGAVRYGFNRGGDELGLFKLDGGAQFALWPDVIEG